MMVKKSCINFEKSSKVKYPQISLELLELKCLDEVVGGSASQLVVSPTDKLDLNVSYVRSFQLA